MKNNNHYGSDSFKLQQAVLKVYLHSSEIYRIKWNVEYAGNNLLFERVRAGMQ